MKTMAIILGTTWAVMLMVAALWGWQNAAQIVAEWRKPSLGYWSVCSAAFGLAAAAQVILLTFVIGNLYRRNFSGEVLRATAGVACTAALIGAVALGFAGR